MESEVNQAFPQPGEPSAVTATGLLAIVALSAGCLETTTGGAEGWLAASIHQAVDATELVVAYQGTGRFNVSPDPGAGVSVAFGLTSNGTGESIGQSLMLVRLGSGRPGRGRYALAPVEKKDGRLEGFTAFYSRTIDGRNEHFTALSGSVEITTSTGGLVAGDFSFTAILYCSVALIGPAPDDWCVGPHTITPEAPQVEVTGSFIAERRKPGLITPH